MEGMIRLPALALAPAVLLAASRYAGSAACAKCHPEQSAAHSRTGHARALSRAEHHPQRGEWPLAATEASRPPRFRIRFDRLTARIDDGTDVLAVPLEWAFGAGTQAVTFVSRGDERNYLEHYLSYYARIRAFGPTPGHAGLAPSNLAEAAGLFYRKGDPESGIEGCFQCHATGGMSGALKGETGVQCESCHGPGLDHAESDGKKAVVHPGRLEARQLNTLCGSCHRPPASDPAKIDWNFAWNVRHQPVYLSQSKCFTRSAGRLTCLTCHAPHQPLTTEPAVYDSKCADCHAGRSAACGPRDCAGCHMPRVSPEPPLRFANHWIGVYGGGAALKPVLRGPAAGVPAPMGAVPDSRKPR